MADGAEDGGPSTSKKVDGAEDGENTDEEDDNELEKEKERIRTCTISFNNILREDLAHLQQDILEAFQATQCEVTDDMSELSVLVQKAGLSVAGGAAYDGRWQADPKDPKILDVRDLLPDKFPSRAEHVHPVLHVARIPDGLQDLIERALDGKECTPEDSDIAMIQSQGFLQHLHASFLGNRGTNSPTKDRHPIWECLMSAIGTSDQPKAPRGLSSTITEALREFCTAFCNLWQGSIYSKMLDYGLRILLRVHLALQREERTRETKKRMAEKREARAKKSENGSKTARARRKNKVKLLLDQLSDLLESEDVDLFRRRVSILIGLLEDLTAKPCRRTLNSDAARSIALQDLSTRRGRGTPAPAHAPRIGVDCCFFWRLGPNIKSARREVSSTALSALPSSPMLSRRTLSSSAVAILGPAASHISLQSRAVSVSALRQSQDKVGKVSTTADNVDLETMTIQPANGDTTQDKKTPYLTARYLLELSEREKKQSVRRQKRNNSFASEGETENSTSRSTTGRPRRFDNTNTGKGGDRNSRPAVRFQAPANIPYDTSKELQFPDKVDWEISSVFESRPVYANVAAGRGTVAPLGISNTNNSNNVVGTHFPGAAFSAHVSGVRSYGDFDPEVEQRLIQELAPIQASKDMDHRKASDVSAENQKFLFHQLSSNFQEIMNPRNDINRFNNGNVKHVAGIQYVAGSDEFQAAGDEHMEKSWKRLERLGGDYNRTSAPLSLLGVRHDGEKGQALLEDVSQLIGQNHSIGLEDKKKFMKVVEKNLTGY